MLNFLSANIHMVVIPFWLQQLQQGIQLALDANGMPWNVACAVAFAIVQGIAIAMGW
jgi:hypothetical protein